MSGPAAGSLPAESHALELARGDLRRRQAEWGVRAGSAPEASPLAASLDCAKRREADCVQDGPYIRDNVFRYPADAERARQALTRQIIEVPARTLDQIWRRARPQLTTIMQSGIPLNAVWGKNS